MNNRFKVLLDQLTDLGCEFVLAGGLAVYLQGYPRATKDVDIIPRLDAESWAILIDHIWGLGGRPRIPESKDSIKNVENIKRWMVEKNMHALTFKSPDFLVELDLLVMYSGEFEDLKKRASVVDLENRQYYVASIDDLIRMKSRAGRPQDLLDIQYLEDVKRRSITSS